LSDKLTIRNCRFAFKCSSKWEDLQDTENDQIKFCNDCQKEVFFCEDDYALISHVRLNHCVAILKPNSKELILGDIKYS